MNTNRIYKTSCTDTSVFQEAKDVGLTRIEISYMANDFYVSQDLYKYDFLEDAQNDLKIVEQCQDEISGVCHRVPLLDLLSAFQEEARYN